MALDGPQTRHRLGFAIVIAVLVLQVGMLAQNSAPSPDQASLAETVRQLQQQVNELRMVVTGAAR
jgi:hypothetical protein